QLLADRGHAACARADPVTGGPGAVARHGDPVRARFQFRAPLQPETSVWRRPRTVAKSILLPAPDGRTVALVAVGGTLLRVRTTPEPEGDPVALMRGSVRLAGVHYLLLTATGAATYERDTGRLVARIEHERDTQWLVDGADLWLLQIGRASCRERVGDTGAA